MNPAAPAGDRPHRILRLPQVCDVSGLGRSMIYQMEADQRFPTRVKIGVRAVGWLEGEVHSWLSKRIALSRTMHHRALRGHAKVTLHHSAFAGHLGSAHATAPMPLR
jgi:prophage regulatory protein